MRIAWRRIGSLSNTSTEREARLAEIKRRADILLVPATRDHATARIRALLSHYYRTDDPVMIQALAISDWVGAVEGAPMWSLDAACRSWLMDPETARQKPLPADIAARLPHVDRYRDRQRPPPRAEPQAERLTPEHEAKLRAETDEMLAQMRRRRQEERDAASAPAAEIFRAVQAADTPAETARLLREVEERDLTNRQQRA